MKNTCYSIVIIFLFGCTSTKDYFSTIQQSEQVDYGYSAENPILIGHYNNWEKNTQLAWHYLSKLKYNEKAFQVIGHATVKKPANQPRKKTIPLRFGSPQSLGAETLDLFVLVTRGESDTIMLYFDVEIKGKTNIPKGLVFDHLQNNDIFK
ncbi:MAG: hypothetical protein Q7J34_07430 [Bacteroidales bacterium]|nr:hypothetical protein [Bacteroidales bacterium]